MRVTRYTFEEVAIKATRKWVDPETGKKRQETRKFSQTINPYNTNADGSRKTRDQIKAEINAQAKEWLTPRLTVEAIEEQS